MRTPQLRVSVFAGALCFVVPFLLPTGGQAQTASQFYNDAVQTYGAGDVDGAKQKLRLALEVDRNFRPAAALLTRIAADEKQADAQTLGVSAATLERVILSVEYKETTFQTAVEILRQRISEKTAGKVAVNFVLKLPPELANKRVSMHLDHVPVTEIMRYLGSLAGAEFKVEQYAVVVVPSGAPTAAAPSPGGSPAPIR